MKKIFIPIIISLGIVSFVSANTAEVAKPISITASVNSAKQIKIKKCKEKLGQKATPLAIKKCAGLVPVKKIKLQKANADLKRVKAEKIKVQQLKPEALIQKKQDILSNIRSHQVKKSEYQILLEKNKEEFLKKIKNAKTPEEKKSIKDAYLKKIKEIKSKSSLEKKDIKQKIKDKKEEYKKRKIKFIKNRLNYLYKRLKIYKNRAERINVRIKNRLSELSKKGVNVSALEEKRQESVKNIKNASRRIEKIKQFIDKFINTPEINKEDLRSLYKEIRENYTAVRSDLRKYFKEAREIIRELKALK